MIYFAVLPPLPEVLTYQFGLEPSLGKGNFLLASETRKRKREP